MVYQKCMAYQKCSLYAHKLLGEKKKIGGGPLLVSSLGIFKCYPLCFHLLDIHLQVYTLLQIDCSFILNVLQSGLVQVFDISAELISYLDIIIP